MWKCFTSWLNVSCFCSIITLSISRNKEKTRSHFAIYSNFDYFVYLSPIVLRYFKIYFALFLVLYYYHKTLDLQIKAPLTKPIIWRPKINLKLFIFWCSLTSSSSCLLKLSVYRCVVVVSSAHCSVYCWLFFVSCRKIVSVNICL